MPEVTVQVNKDHPRLDECQGRNMNNGISTALVAGEPTVNEMPREVLERRISERLTQQEIARITTPKHNPFYKRPLTKGAFGVCKVKRSI